MKRWVRARERGADDLFANSLVTILEPGSVASEAYRTLRTSILYARADVPPKVIVITSCGPYEGKTTTCANLGVVLAQAGKSVLVVDCDLRTPSMHKIFGIPNLRGATDLLIDTGDDLPGSWQEPLPELKVLTAGARPPNPLELLGSQRFAELVGWVRQEFDYVLLDAPPVGVVSDPLVLAAQGDGVLLVLDVQKTRKVSLQQAVSRLEAVGANVLGTVMNNVKHIEDGYHYLDTRGLPK
jgi:receptor protein-tyrosine kinase